MGLPQQGTTEQILARSLTNEALAQRVDMIAAKPQEFTRKQRDEYLIEAARRLRWPDAYEQMRR